MNNYNSLIKIRGDRPDLVTKVLKYLLYNIFSNILQQFCLV